MQITKSLLDIHIFSFRSEIIDFCKNQLSEYGVVSVNNPYEIPPVKNNTVLIIDVSSIIPGTFFWCGQNNYSTCSICLVPPGCNQQVLHYCECCFNQIVYFPSSFSVIVNFCREKIEKVTSAYFIEHKPIESLSTNVLGKFLGSSKLISDVREKIKRVASNEAPVLLLGETGTGKTTAADVIHKLSCRKNKKIERLNVPAIVDSLAASSFFGTETGAYTDALMQDGAFRIANKGTLFFDEIGMASKKVQAILLDVIESGRIKSVGSDENENIDVRMIFATNSNLQQMIQQGEFRQDLFQRIADNVIYMPTLRERKEDIRQIVYGFLEKEPLEITESALMKLEDYDWPGNIRELEKCIARAADRSMNNVIKEKDIEFVSFNHRCDFQN